MILSILSHLLAFALGALFVLAVLFACGVRAMWSLAKPAITRSLQAAQEKKSAEEAEEKRQALVRVIHHAARVGQLDLRRRAN